MAARANELFAKFMLDAKAEGPGGGMTPRSMRDSVATQTVVAMRDKLNEWLDGCEVFLSTEISERDLIHHETETHSDSSDSATTSPSRDTACGTSARELQRIESAGPAGAGTSQIGQAERYTLRPEGSVVQIDYDRTVASVLGGLCGWSAGFQLDSMPLAIVPLAICFAAVVPSEALVCAFPDADWTYAFYAVSYSLAIPYVLLALASLQLDLLRPLLQYAYVLCLLACSLVLLIARVYGSIERLDRLHFYLSLPNYFVSTLWFWVLGTADALRPRTRQRVLRFAGPGACIVLGIFAITPRLARAEQHSWSPWYALGAENVHSAGVCAAFSIVLLLLLLRVVWASWRTPDQLTTLRSALSIIETDSLL